MRSEPGHCSVLRALPLRQDDVDLPPLPLDLDDNSSVLDHLDEVAREAGVESCR